MTSAAHEAAGKRPPPHWGILGGMGPLASAAFLDTIYELSVGRPEQDMPVVSVLSDPTMPDRTAAFLKGDDAVIAARIEDGLRRLAALGSTNMVIACFTAHHVLPLVVEPLRACVLSLVDVLIDALASADGRFVLMCSTGSRSMRLFERSPAWRGVQRRIVWPDEREQRLVHQLIYDVKKHRADARHAAALERIVKAHRATSFVAACTELHVVLRQWPGIDRLGVAAASIDPLALVAAAIAGLGGAATVRPHLTALRAASIA